MRSKIAQRILSETPQSVREFVKKYGESIINNGNMKVKLILLAEPILVSDEEIKEGWKGDAFKHDVKGYIFEHFYTENSWYKDAKKIIAGIPELPSITYSDEALEVLEKKYGWVDAERISHIHAKKEWPFWTYPKQYEECRQNFIKGFNAAQSLNEKKFSEEEIKPLQELLDDGYDAYDQSHHLQVQRMLKVIETFIQSISQPKEVDVEVETEDLNDYDDDEIDGLLPILRIKITNNSIKVIKVL